MNAIIETSAAEQGALIFVTGASRSGTTLLSRIIGNHSRVLGLNELQFFGDLQDIDACAMPLKETDLVDMCAMLMARQARDIWTRSANFDEVNEARQLVAGLKPEHRNGFGIYACTVAHLAKRAGKDTACEQTPRNIFYARQLLDHYQSARLVHIVRDPRAVLASQKNRWKVRKLGGKNVPMAEVIRLWFNYHPVTMSQLWNRATDTALALEAHPRVRLLRFEDLVAAPDIVVRELSDWLDLEYEGDMLDVPQWGSSNIRHNTQASGVSKEMVSKWKDVLTPGEIAISERMTAACMQRLSYEPVSKGGLPISAVVQLVFKYPVHVLGALVSKPRRFFIQLKALLRTQKKQPN